MVTWPGVRLPTVSVTVAAFDALAHGEGRVVGLDRLLEVGWATGHAGRGRHKAVELSAGTWAVTLFGVPLAISAGPESMAVMLEGEFPDWWADGMATDQEIVVDTSEALARFRARKVKA